MNKWSLKRLKRPLSVLATVYGSLLILVPGPVFGEVGLRVVTDIAPIQSLVWRVMDGLGEPAVLVPPGTSPHHYSLRPSDASVLQQADLVFFVGAGLTPWLEGRLSVLSPRADKVNLSSAPGVVIWPYRTLAPSHEDEPEDGHEHSHGDGHGHSHGDADDAVDPHMWLDPVNAREWLILIGEVLAGADRANATRYRENAREGAEEISDLMDQLTHRVVDLKKDGFIVFHDAYQYWERRFGFSVQGAMLPADASTPSPKRLKALRALAETGKVSCVLSEPQFDRSLIDSVFASQSIRIGMIDPEGVGLTPGPSLYAQLLSDVVERVSECLQRP